MTLIGIESKTLLNPCGYANKSAVNTLMQMALHNNPLSIA